MRVGLNGGQRAVGFDRMAQLDDSQRVVLNFVNLKIRVIEN